MRIGIDVREIKKGVFTGLRTVLKNFFTVVPGTEKHEFVFFGNQHTDINMIPAEGEKIVLRETVTFWWDQVRLPIALRKADIDVFFTPYIKTPFCRVCPYVNVVSDVIPLNVPKYKGVKAVLEKVHFWITVFIYTRRASRTVTISKDVKDRAAKIFGINTRKFEVIYPAVTFQGTRVPDKRSEEELIKKYELDKPYILYLGNFKPHKNLTKLIEAFDALPRRIKNTHRAVLVGGSEEEIKKIRSDMKGKVLEKIITIKGGLNRADISIFLKKAAIFVFPSLFEGFGMPPVEAMAAGVPVAASRLAPMTEVLGDAAVFFDPHDPEDISGTILGLLEDETLRGQCVTRGKERASLFDTGEMAEKMIKVLEDAGEKKTLCISSEFPPGRGGIATYVYNLWSRLPKNETVILTANTAAGRSCPDKDINVVRRSYPLGSNMISRFLRTIAVTVNVWKLNRSMNIRHNHCAQVMSSGLAGLVMKKTKHIPYTVYVYSADILEFSGNFITRRVMKKVFDESSNIVACSRFAKSAIQRRGLAAEDKVTVITPGVDTDRFGPKKGEDGVRQKFGIPLECKVLLSVSRLDARKGHDSVIRSLADVVKTCPDVVYVVIGDGKEKTKLKNLAKRLSLEGNVKFAGSVSEEELVSFYNTCDMFIMVPRHIAASGNVEGFGIVYLEANACGKPVIAGKSGGVPEAVIDGETGILVDPENPAEIRDAIMILLKDSKYAKDLGDNGFLRVNKEFNWAPRAERLGELIYAE